MVRGKDVIAQAYFIGDRQECRPAAAFANLSDDRFSLFRAAAVMDDYLSSGSGQSKCTGSPDATGGSGNKGGLS